MVTSTPEKMQGLKTISAIIVLFSVSKLTSVQGGSEYERADILSEHPNVCYKETYTKSLSRGERMFRQNCGYIECNMMDGQLFWGNHYCDKVFVPSGCKIEQHSQFAYPLCCPRLAC